MAEHWEKKVMGYMKWQIPDVQLGKNSGSNPQGTLPLDLGRTRWWFPWENGILSH